MPELNQLETAMDSPLAGRGILICRTLFWSLAVLIGFCGFWVNRQNMNMDGISYLDIGDAFWRGNWANAVNGLWSPAYAVFLGFFVRILEPSIRHEFILVHAINFMLFVLTFMCFEWFWSQLFLLQSDITRDATWQDYSALAWWITGYSLFLWSALNLTTIWAEGPDMMVAGVVYLVSGLIIRIRRGYSSWFNFGLLGAVLGLGYLIKAPMFVLGFLFVALAAFAGGKQGFKRCSFTIVIFIIVASPFAVSLSNKEGRPTFGESGRLNYAWHVDGVPWIGWIGGNPLNGYPTHPLRKLGTDIAIYEFGSPITATYSPWFDPSYWNDGLKPYFDWRKQIVVIIDNLKVYSDFLSRPSAALFSLLIVLFFTSARKWKIPSDLLASVYLWLPGVVALAMYVLVHVEDRYIAPFVVILFAGLLIGVRLPISAFSERLLFAASLSILIIFGSSIVGSTVMQLASGGTCGRFCAEQPAVAEELLRSGLRPGDKVACIGIAPSAYWARLTRVSIVADMHSEDAATFWNAPREVQDVAIANFRKTGAVAIIAEPIPPPKPTSNWTRIPNTDHYVYWF